MVMKGFGIGQKRKITSLVINGTTYTYGTHFVCEYIDINPYPTERRSKTLVGGRKLHYNVTSDGASIEARVKLNNDGGTTSSYDIYSAITTSEHNRSVTNSVTITDYDDAGNTITTYASHADSRVIITAGPMSREAGCIYFDLYIDVDNITIAES